MVVVSALEGVAKPDERIYRITLERLGVAPQEALFVDDSPVNVEAARKLGIQTVLFTTPEALERELEKLGIWERGE